MATKKTTAPSATKKAAAVPAAVAAPAAPATPAPAPAAAEAKPVVNTPVVNIVDSLLEKISTLEKELRTMRNEVKKINGAYAKSLKEAQQAAKKRRRVTNGATGGITRPVKISAGLANFLGLAADATISRIDVMKAIVDYVKKNNLSNPQNGHEIRVDDTLAKLFGMKAGETMDWFKSNPNSKLKAMGHFIA